MIYEKRKELILKMLDATGIVQIQKLMKQCKVSEITVRRDLIDLESNGLLVRTHGGAVKSKAVEMLFSYDFKINQHRQNKEDICQSAANYIQEGDVIFVDCGTTLSMITKYIIKFRSLTVITTSLPVVSELIRFPNIRVSLIGGEIDNERQATYGTLSEFMIEKHHAKKAFIAADGISLKKGLSSYDYQESSTTKKMIENSDEIFLLCDSSKIEKNSLIIFAPITDIHHLITDKEITPEQLKMYQEYGVDVVFDP